MTKERRKYSRLRVYHLAKYRPISDPGSQPITTSIRDIGGGGVCLVVNEQLPVASVIQLYINFPGFSQAIPSLAKIVWTRKLGKSNRYETGIQFLEIEDILREAIIKRVEYVHQKLTKRR